MFTGSILLVLSLISTLPFFNKVKGNLSHNKRPTLMRQSLKMRHFPSKYSEEKSEVRKPRHSSRLRTHRRPQMKTTKISQNYPVQNRRSRKQSRFSSKHTPRYSSKHTPRFSSNTKYSKKSSPSVYAGIVIPDVQVVLDVILASAQAIQDGLAVILADTTAVVGTAVNTAKTEEIALIEPIIVAGNTEMYNQIDAILAGLSGQVDQIVEEISQAEHTSSSAVLVVKDTTLVQNIRTLMTTLQTTLDTLVSQQGTDELNGLVTLIEQENDNLFNQITTILNDPNNNNPALPQLVFPDPVAIASSIEPGRDTLVLDVQALLTQFIQDVRVLLTATETGEKDDITVIMNDGTAELISRLENITNDLLVQVQEVIDTVTLQETTDVTAAITPVQDTLTATVNAEIATLQVKCSDLITQVTVTELADMSTVLVQYNEDIAQGLVSNLTV